jgi:hypothetical protein
LVLLDLLVHKEYKVLLDHKVHKVLLEQMQYPITYTPIICQHRQLIVELSSTSIIMVLLHLALHILLVLHISLYYMEEHMSSNIMCQVDYLLAVLLAM